MGFEAEGRNETLWGFCLWCVFLEKTPIPHQPAFISEAGRPGPAFPPRQYKLGVRVHLNSHSQLFNMLQFNTSDSLSESLQTQFIFTFYSISSHVTPSVQWSV